MTGPASGAPPAEGSVRQDSVPRRLLGTRVRRMPDRTLVAGPGGVRELDEAATFLLRRMDGSRTVAELAERLRAEYADLDAEVAVADTAELVTDLADCRVVEIVTPGR